MLVVLKPIMSVNCGLEILFFHVSQFTDLCKEQVCELQIKNIHLDLDVCLLISSPHFSHAFSAYSDEWSIAYFLSRSTVLYCCSSVKLCSILVQCCMFIWKTHTHTYTYIHTYIHTYIFKYICIVLKKWVWKFYMKIYKKNNWQKNVACGCLDVILM
jgi:hypothetical protein